MEEDQLATSDKCTNNKNQADEKHYDKDHIHNDANQVEAEIDSTVLPESELMVAKTCGFNLNCVEIYGRRE